MLKDAETSSAASAVMILNTPTIHLTLYYPENIGSVSIFLHGKALAEFFTNLNRAKEQYDILVAGIPQPFPHISAQIPLPLPGEDKSLD